MRVRFQADANLDERIRRGLCWRAPAIDFQTAHVAGLKGLPDDRVLAFCADHGRVLVTQDRRTMVAHLREFVARRESPGVIVVRRRVALGIVIDEL